MPEFVKPQYLWLLLGIPVVMIFWFIGLMYHRVMRKRFGNLDNLRDISRVSWVGRGWIRGFLFILSLACMIIGLAYPQMLARNLRPLPMPTDVIFMLDISPSMFARDMDPNRLGHAEKIIQQFIMRKQPQDRYALVTYNFNSVILSYLTRDPEGVLLYFDFLNQTEEPTWGSNMGAAMVSALRVIQADEISFPEEAKKRRRILVMISDGDDNIGQWGAVMPEIARRHLKIYSFGLGTANGAPVPQMLNNGEITKYVTTAAGERITTRAQARTLRDLSERTGARFYRGEDTRQVNDAMEEILVNGRPVAGYEANPIRQDLFTHFLVAALVFMAAAIFL
jgi:Ca-activated chloride channel family protein